MNFNIIKLIQINNYNNNYFYLSQNNNFNIYNCQFQYFFKGLIYNFKNLYLFNNIFYNFLSNIIYKNKLSFFGDFKFLNTFQLISENEDLNISNSFFFKCKATSDYGGIIIHKSINKIGNLNILKSTFSNCSSFGTYEFGGGVINFEGNSSFIQFCCSNICYSSTQCGQFGRFYLNSMDNKPNIINMSIIYFCGSKENLCFGGSIYLDYGNHHISNLNISNNNCIISRSGRTGGTGIGLLSWTGSLSLINYCNINYNYGANIILTGSPNGIFNNLNFINNSGTDLLSSLILIDKLITFQNLIWKNNIGIFFLIYNSGEFILDSSFFDESITGLTPKTILNCYFSIKMSTYAFNQYNYCKIIINSIGLNIPNFNFFFYFFIFL